MKKHIKNYLEGSGNCPGDWIGCEVCGGTAVDVHHIDPRGMGGSKEKDDYENLIGLCRTCHLKAEAKQLSKEFLYEKHNGVTA